MSNGLLPIGAFSRATLISVPALRRYHESGLLVPATIDPDTGYRSYAEGQLNDAAVIRRLRLLDVPLESVARVIAARDPDVTRAVLVEHEQLMAERLDETKRIIAELQAGAEAPSLLSPIHLRNEPGHHMLAIGGHVEEAHYPDFLGEAFPELYAIADRVASNAVVLDRPVVERYLVSFPDNIDPTEFQTEIYWPVAAIDQPQEQSP